MKKANRRPRTAKGAVLIMVLTVMFVLIFLLAGTIAVVYSANNRAMKKYQESQAYYTARSVLDTYIETFLHDNDNVTGSNGSTAVTYYYIDTKDSSATAPKSVAAKQARAFELDLYDLAVDLDTVTAGVQTDISTVTDANLPDWVKEYILQLATGSEHPVKDILTGVSRNTSITEAEQARQIYSTAHSTEYDDAKAIAGNAINPTSSSFGSYTGEKYTYTNYGNYYKQFEITSSTPTTKVKYQVPADSITDYGKDGTSGSLGKVIDKGTTATLTVEMLERKYHLGTTGTAFKQKFDNGSREKDYVKIEVTCEIYYDGQPTTTSVIYATKYDPKPSSNKALVSLGDIKPEKSLIVYGGAASLAKSSYNWDNQSQSAGNVFLQGSVNLGNTQYTPVLSKEDIFYLGGDLTINAAAIVDTYIEEGATFFCNKFTTTDRGLSSKKINLICQQYLIACEPSGVTKGNVYAEEFILDDYTPKYKNNKTAVEGDVYCNYFAVSENNFPERTSITNTTTSLSSASLIISDTGSRNFNNIVTSGTIHIAKGYKFLDSSGNVKYTVDFNGTGATITVEGTTQTINVTTWNDSALTIKNATKPAELKVKYESQDTNGNLIYEDSEQDFTYNTTTFKKKFTLPAALIGSGKTEIELDTIKSLYNNYFKSAATTSGTYAGLPFGKYGDFYDETAAAFGDFKNPPGKSNFAQFISEHIVEPQDKNSSVNSTTLTLTSFNPQTIPATDTDLSAVGTAVGATGYINHDFMLPGQNVDGNKYNDMQNKTYIIDTRGGEVDIQMGDGTGGQFSGTFVVYGENNANFLFPAATNGVTYKLGDDKTFVIYDYNVGKTPSPLRLGTSSNPTPAPKIQMIAAKGVGNIYFGQQGVKQIQGYVYAPYTTVGMGDGMGGTNTDIVYNDTNIGNYPVGIIGSIFCADYSAVQDRIGVAFIDPDQQTTPPGDKIFGWTDVLYMKGV